MCFSVLLSVYKNESPAFLNQCLVSVYYEQTVKPNEIVLVEDGKLTTELYSVVNDWQKRLGSIFKSVRLNENCGLGDALNIGLQYCSYELVARMDTDDIAHSNRFEKQLAVFHKHDIDVCGSWIIEFDKVQSSTTGIRKLPEMHHNIERYAKFRCPVNHPSVMYKKSSVNFAGGYERMIWFEDYYLWARMLIKGAKFYNIQEPLLSMRAGSGQLERRSGFSYVKKELRFLLKLREIGFLNYLQFLVVVGLRLSIRLMPRVIISKVYKLLRG